jgi:hypothetical protein
MSLPVLRLAVGRNDIGSERGAYVARGSTIGFVDEPCRWRVNDRFQGMQKISRVTDLGA